jgi:REP element-mobilizing transposase RayT
MARPLRIEFSGAVYHVTTRGNERREIFFGDDDRSAFLDILGKVCERFNWICHAYCQMGNHYHLLIETPEANLSKGMRQLNGVYTQYINRTHGRVGHLFQGRFKGILVQKETHLLELARYIMLNPVHAGMVSKAGDWPWSSYRGTLGLEHAPGFLTTDWLLSNFGKSRRTAVGKFSRFVEEGKRGTNPWAELRGQIFLGSDRFVEQMQRRISPDQALRDIPLRQRRPPARDLSHYATRYPDRDHAMAEAYRSGAYSLQAIGEFFGVGRMTASRAVKKYEID